MAESRWQVAFAVFAAILLVGCAGPQRAAANYPRPCSETTDPAECAAYKAKAEEERQAELRRSSELAQQASCSVLVKALREKGNRARWRGSSLGSGLGDYPFISVDGRRPPSGASDLSYCQYKVQTASVGFGVIVTTSANRLEDLVIVDDATVFWTAEDPPRQCLQAMLVELPLANEPTAGTERQSWCPIIFESGGRFTFPAKERLGRLRQARQAGDQADLVVRATRDGDYFVVKVLTAPKGCLSVDGAKSSGTCDLSPVRGENVSVYAGPRQHYEKLMGGSSHHLHRVLSGKSDSDGSLRMRWSDFLQWWALRSQGQDPIPALTADVYRKWWDKETKEWRSNPVRVGRVQLPLSFVQRHWNERFAYRRSACENHIRAAETHLTAKDIYAADSELGMVNRCLALYRETDNDPDFERELAKRMKDGREWLGRINVAGSAQPTRASCSFEGIDGVECELRLCAKIAAKVKGMRPNGSCFAGEPLESYRSDWGQATAAIDRHAGALRRRGDTAGFRRLLARFRRCKTPRWFRSCSN